ncbi:undecaprenyl/decaprenyl-phosphate alpha-N-acetylglucosaminyl 1-phosphate transferase [bacterium]|nr:undecaprenyl/decaprenyl-phosphate alpha-N-acetylglucosaminyl 1-phosphate transferase [bacterium]
MLWVSLLTFLFGVLAYFPIRFLALKCNVVDRPDGKLKTHSDATPYLGGLIVYAALLMGLFIEIYVLKFPAEPFFKGLFIASTFIVFLGVLDDMYRMSWIVKLLGQLLLVIIMFSYDIRVDFDFLPPIANSMITVLWMLFIINSYNIIDVSDGVSGITFAAFLASSAIIATFTGDKGLALIIYPLIGGVFAFLVFNLPKARIFAGDGGSMFFGFIAGVISIRLSYTAFNRLSNLAPLIISIYPIFETSLVVFSRLRRRLSPFRGSPHHFPIRLKKMGFSDMGVVLQVTIIAVFGAATGVLSVFLKGIFPLVFGAAVSLLVLAGVLLLDLRGKKN